MWVGPGGQTLSNNLIHAPYYDSAMFIAYLTVIPALAFFMMHLESDFFVRLNNFNKDIQNHASLKQIKQASNALGLATNRALWKIFLSQAVVCLIAIALAPIIIDHFSMQYQQIGILRFGILGTLFHFLFLACSSMLLFLNQSRAYFYLQLLFLICNASLTYLTTQLGYYSWGLGYLGATMLCAFLAVIWLEKSLTNLPYVIFNIATTRTGDNDWLRLRTKKEGSA